MGKIVDSLDYRADNFEVAPLEDWRIMQAGIAKKSKKLPRFCRPACEYYQPDSDKSCKLAFECEYFVFDTHVVSEGEKVFTVLFGTNSLDPNEGVAWQVGEKYLREYLTDEVVNGMLKDFYKLIKPSDDGIVI